MQKQTRPLRFDMGFLFLHALLPEKCGYQKKKRKLLVLGERRLDKALDVTKIVRQNMLFGVLKHLYLDKEERKLARKQYRSTVL